jgi:drug/metabolite transporter (DMT)-like permease
MRIGKVLVVLIGLLLIGYYFYLAMQSEQLIGKVVLVIGAAYFLWLTIIIFRERELTKDDRTRKWFKKDYPKGKHYSMAKGVFYFGLPLGYCIWAVDQPFNEGSDLLYTSVFHFVIYGILGIVIGRMNWNIRLQDSHHLGLLNNQEQIK